jgi:parallel beta-helix repeat protein
MFVGCLQKDGSNVIRSNTVNYFGAKGDSITDDTKAIQKAVDSGYGQIFFLSGSYRITEPVEVDLDKTGPVALNGFGTARIIMDGPGPAFRFNGTHEGTADRSTFKKNEYENQRMPLVDGLEIIGRHPEAVGIEASGTMQLTITRVLVNEAFHGIHLFSRNRNVIISGCHLYNNRGIGIYLDEIDLHQINITSCHIMSNRGGGIVVRKGYVRNLQVGSCDIESNMIENGPATANVFIDVTEGSMLEGAIVGCSIQHGPFAMGSANIWFIGHGTENRTMAGNFTVANNVISDAQYNMHIQYGRGIIITGNTFWEGWNHNILIEQSDHIVVGPNLFDRSPAYDKMPGIKRFGDSRDRIIIRESKNLTINGIQLYNTIGGPGIVLEKCQNYTLMNSTVLNCDEGGILLRETEKGQLSGNFIDHDNPEVRNFVAIQVEGGKNNLITNNYTNGLINGEPGTAKILNNHKY